MACWTCKPTLRGAGWVVGIPQSHRNDSLNTAEDLGDVVYPGSKIELAHTLF